MSATRETLKNGSLRIKAYCTCGGKFDASTNPHWRAEELYRQWRTIHDGPDHLTATPREAAAARRKADL